MNRVAVIGAGVAGLASAQMLRNRADVVVFEQEDRPGGLIRCANVDGALFHLCGGHVFNTKDGAVARWFWSWFDRDRDFFKKDRNSAICLEGNRFVDYPIENHVYQLPEQIQKKVYDELEEMMSAPVVDPTDFGDFLLKRFGKTLCEVYFRPYNEKIWRCDLSRIPLSWLAGKLPMPSPGEILRANKEKIEEKEFVHSSFFYPKHRGSQFIADTLSQGLRIRYSTEVKQIESDKNGGCLVNGERFDEVVFCGNIKFLPDVLRGVELGSFVDEIRNLESHGTTAVFCEIDPNPYSWFYQPLNKHQSHRVICTGNFSISNNGPHPMTGTVEFTDSIGKEQIVCQLAEMPCHPKYIAHHYSQYSYPIQHSDTRRMIATLKARLSKYHIFLVGRFSEWEYFNMDAVISSAMALFGSHSLKPAVTM